MILLLWYFENKNEQKCFTLKSARCTCAVTAVQRPRGRLPAAARSCPWLRGVPSRQGLRCVRSGNAASKPCGAASLGRETRGAGGGGRGRAAPCSQRGSQEELGEGMEFAWDLYCARSKGEQYQQMLLRCFFI